VNGLVSLADRRNLRVNHFTSFLPFDFPYYGTDSLPLFIRSLRVLNNKKLITSNQEFLNNQILHYFNTVFDEDSGLVKTNRHFSTMKDYAKRKSSCYSNVMVAVLKNELHLLGVLDNPFAHINLRKNIKDTFWNGSHFVDELNGYDFVTGDANIIPFWTDVFTSKPMLRRCVDKIQEEGLDKPFPLRYYHSPIKEHKMISLEFFAKNYERDTVWTHLGPMFISLMKRLGKADDYINQYKTLIELNKNYLEIFNQDGSPYETFFYYTDEGMLWASMYLDLL